MVILNYREMKILRVCSNKYMFFKKIYACIYLKAIERETRGEKQQGFPVTGSLPKWLQEPHQAEILIQELHPELSWEAGAQKHKAFSVASSNILAESWIANAAAETHTHTFIGYTSVPGNDLVH